MCQRNSDLGSMEENCSWGDNKYCLKLKIKFDPELKEKTEMYEKNLSNDQLLSVLSTKERQELLNTLEARK